MSTRNEIFRMILNIYTAITVTVNFPAIFEGRTYPNLLFNIIPPNRIKISLNIIAIPTHKGNLS